MKKKLFVTAILLAIFSFSLVSFTFAANGADNVVNNVRNFVGGAENVVEDAGKGIVNGVKDGMNAIGNGSKNVTNGIENGMDNNRDGRQTIDNRATNSMDGYTATRTSTDTGAAGMFSATSNVWTWLVLAIVGIVIVALVMYYAKQSNVTTYNHNDNDD